MPHLIHVLVDSLGCHGRTVRQCDDKSVHLHVCPFDTLDRCMHGHANAGMHVHRSE